MPNKVPTPVSRAAEVRAHGGSWAAAAKASGWAEKGLDRWVRTHVQLWAREVGRARRFSRDEACDESVAALRKRLRSEADKTVIDSAKVIGDRFQPKPKPRPAPAKNMPGQFLDLLAEIPEEKVTRVDRHIQAAEDEGRALASLGIQRAE